MFFTELNWALEEAHFLAETTEQPHAIVPRNDNDYAVLPFELAKALGEKVLEICR